MLSEKIKCCSLFEAFVREYEGCLSLELVSLQEGYVLELRGQLHLEQGGAYGAGSTCGGGCISCGPEPAAKDEPWRTVPFETVWRICPFCGGNFVRPGT